MKVLLIIAGKTIAIILAGLVSFVVLGTIVFSLWFYHYDNQAFYQDKFNREKWLTDDGVDKCIRGRMYEDLVANYLKNGLTKKEVIWLVGEPYFGRVYHRFYGDKKCYEYLIGRCKWVPAGDALLVCFNRDEKVIDVFRSDGYDSGESMYLNKLNLKE